MLPRLAPGARVACVGGGSVGIVAAKEVLDAGLTPVVFESRNEVGGVWGQHWDSLVTNSSRHLMSLSGFPLPPTVPTFPPKAAVVQYMKDFVAHFGLAHRLRLGVTVTSVTPRPDGRWDVVTEPAHHGGVFDAVCVCTGQFTNPVMPDLPVADFRGRVRHSRDYRNAADLEGRHVVVVGLGNSALDIALEAAQSGAASVTVSVRSRSNLLPVANADGSPRDVELNTRYFHLLLPRRLRTLLFVMAMRRAQAAFDAAGMPPDGDTPVLRQRIANLKQTAAWEDMLASGRIRLTSNIVAASASAVTVADGSRVPCDELICCTGYRQTFPYLPPAVLDGAVFDYAVTDSRSTRALTLARRVMHAEHPTLCFLASIASLGNDICVGQLQARWALSMLTGTAEHLLTRDDLRREVAARRRHLEATRMLFPQFVQYVKYCDGLAADMGVLPPVVTSLWEAAKHPVTAWRMWFGPAAVWHYGSPTARL